MPLFSKFSFGMEVNVKRDFIRSIYEDTASFGGKEVVVGGWVRNLRDSKAFGFIDLNDGSCFKSAQVVSEREKIANYDEIARQNIGASLVVKGVVELTPTMKQPFEIKATEVLVEGTSTPEYSSINAAICCWMASVKPNSKIGPVMVGIMGL